MDIFNDFDLCQEALKKVNLNEAAMPIVRGVIVEDVDTYNKIQKLLNIQAFEPCHRFLYNLDVEQLSEGEASKVNNLYKLAEERGFIEKEEPEEAEDESAPTKECDAIPAMPTPAPVAPAQPLASTTDSAFTVAYSAVKDGQLKTGEAYSNAISTRAAKADVISKLERAGYSSISILCIEVGDPDVRGCNSTYCMQAERASNEDEKVNEWGRYETGLSKGPMRDPSPADMAAWSNTHDHAYMQKRNAAASLKRTIDSFKKYDNKVVDWEQIAQTEDNGVTYYWMKTPEGTLVCAVENDPQDDNLDFYIVDDKNKIMTMVGQSYGVGEEFEFNPTGAEYEIPKDMPAVTEADDDSDSGSDDSGDDSDSSDDSDSDSSSDDSDSDSDDSDDSKDDSDSDSDDDSEDKDDSDDKKEEDAEEPDEKLDDKSDEKAEDAKNDKDADDLKPEEKTALKDSYKKAFKAALQKCKFETSFSELTLEQKVKFFTELSKAWGDKADPSKFLTDKELEQLEKIVVKKPADNKDE